MGKPKLNIHKVTIDRDSLKYLNFNKNRISYEMMLNEILIYKIIEDSKIKSKKIFKQLPSKIYFHYDWKELFKYEINQQIKIIFKIYNKIENNFVIQLPNENYLENKLIPKVDSISQRQIDFRTYYKSINTNTIENFIRKSLFPQCNKYNKRVLKILNSENNTEYDHIIEYQLKDKGINLIELYKNYTTNQEAFNTHFINDLNYNSNIQDYNLITKLYSHIIYLFFLTTKLKANKINLQDLEMIVFDKFSFVDDKLIDDNIKEVKNLETYTWKSKKGQSLKKLYNNLKKYNVIECSLTDFKNIFSTKNIKDINPIKVEFEASELIYFINSLMELNYINTESNLNHNRLKSCFLKKNGNPFTENISVIKNHIKNEKNPSVEKKIKINQLLNID